MNVKQINKYLIDTPEGWCNFYGIKKTTIPYHFIIYFTDGTILKGSENHQVQLSQGSFWEISLLIPGDELMGGKITDRVECIEEPLDVYDILRIENNSNSYYASDIVNHNCAFIEGIDRIYTSIMPTLATGGGCIALSSPNGVGNWFHKTFTDAEFGKNGFVPISLPWDVHPERSQEWYEKECENMSPREIAQEYECSFLGSGATVVDPEHIDYYEQNYIVDPIEKRFMGGDFWIWQYPDFTKSYIVCADVARGDGSDYSAFHIIDAETCEQVAEYNSQLPTREFGHMLVSVATEYNNALLVVENASVGWDVINTIIERNYSNLYYSPRSYGDMTMNKWIDKLESEQTVPGFTNSSRTRPLVISKMESYIRDKTLIFRSKRLLEQIRVFVWKGGKAQAQSGYNDDLVMSLGIGLFIRDTALKFQSQNMDVIRASISGIRKTGYESIYPSIQYPGNGNGIYNPYQININGQIEDTSWVLK